MYKSLAITSLVFFNSLSFFPKPEVETDNNELLANYNTDDQDPRPKNVILMIGDGMGIT